MSRMVPVPDEIASAARLEALDAYGILDTPPEQGFDDLVDLAALICGTPMALVSLVAGDRQWFKARAGFELCQTPLDQSVCAHALGRSSLLIIPDLTLDARTSDNPLVTGAPFLRFYAGAPLETTEGERLGTLCVMDPAPRPEGLTTIQASALLKLACQVMNLMEMRRAVALRDAGLGLQRATFLRNQALIEAQAAISSAEGDLDAILEALVAGAMKAVPQAEGGVIELREGEELVYRTVRGNLVPHRGLRLPLHGSLSGHCLLNNEAVSSPDVLLDGRVKRDVIALLSMRSAMYVPVFRGGTAIAVLKLQSGRVGAFSEGDLEAARLFAGTVAAGLAEAGEADARRTVRASQDRYRAVFNSAIDYAILVMDLDGRVDDWNEGATRILGWSLADMHRRPADIFFTPDDRAMGVAAMEMRSALEVGRCVDERWHLRKDGSRFWGNGEMMTLRDEAGTAIGFLKILRDRTEQRNAAAKLQSSESFMRSVLDSSADCIKVLDLEARLGFMNEGGQRVMEVDDFDGVAGKDWTEFWEGSGRDEARAAVKAALLGGIGRFTGPARTLKGTAKWWDVQVTPIRDGDGNVARLLAVSRDVTANRQTEIALRASETNLRTILETVPVGILFAEAPSGRIVGGNARIEEILSHPVLPSPTLEAYGEWQGYHPDGRPVAVLEYPVARVIAENVDRAALQMTYQRVDGTRLWIECVAAAVRDADGRLMGAVAAIADIDARKRAEAQRDLLNGELSHRMKNLLTMVQAIAAQTLRGATDIEAAKEVLADRLITLGKAHDLLLGGAAERAPIEPVIRGGVGSQDDATGRIHYHGDTVEIGGRAALSLSLMIHELATNAVKYGALSGPDGHVDIEWTVSDGDQPVLAIAWRERGGPRVTPPSRKGFGSRLIERGLVGAVDGSISLTYPPEGVRCVFEAPLRNFKEAF